MKKFITLAIAAVLVCAMFTGCSKKEAANEAKPFRMITEATFPPYEFLRGQEIVGIDVEISKAIAEKLGRPFQVDTVDFDSVIPAIISGKADIAAAGITVTEDRKKNVDFSIPYVTTGIVIIYKKSSPITTTEAAKGKRIAVQGGTTSDAFVLETLGQEPDRFRSPAEAVAALKAGRADIVIADIDPAKNCIKGEDDLAITDFVTSESYAVAIKKGQPELLKVIDETISEMIESGRLAEIVKAYTEEADALKD